MFKQKLNQKKSGFSIMEMIIAAAIGAVVLMALSSLMINSNKEAKRASNKIAFNDFIRTLQKSISDQAQCSAIFSGLAINLGTNASVALGAPAGFNAIAAGVAIKNSDLKITNVSMTATAGPTPEIRSTRLSISVTQTGALAGQTFKEQNISALLKVDPSSNFVECLDDDPNPIVEVSTPVGGATPMLVPSYCLVDLNDPNTSNGCEVEVLVQEMSNGRTWARAGKITGSKQLDALGVPTGKMYYHYYSEGGSTDSDTILPDGTTKSRIASFADTAYIDTAAQAIANGHISTTNGYSLGKNEKSLVVWAKPGFRAKARFKSR